MITAEDRPPLLGLYEVQVDPAEDLDPAERTRLALELYQQQVQEAEAELSTSVDTGPIGPDDWSWSAVLARVRSSAEDQARTTGTTVPPTLIVAAAGLVDLLIEGAAQADVRDVDLAAFVDLPVMALCAVREAWSHPERWRE